MFRDNNFSLRERVKKRVKKFHKDLISTNRTLVSYTAAPHHSLDLCRRRRMPSSMATLPPPQPRYLSRVKVNFNQQCFSRSISRKRLGVEGIKPRRRNHDHRYLLILASKSSNYALSSSLLPLFFSKKRIIKI